MIEPHHQPDQEERSMKFHINENLIRKYSMGPDPIKLLQWNLTGVTIKKDSTLLDLGSGRGLTAVYLANTYDCNVYALDKWVGADEALAAISECDPLRWPVPLHGDARELPFPSNYFEAVISTDSFIYFGTDDLYVPYLAGFIKPGGRLCFTVPGFNREAESDALLPAHLRPFWADECWTWHTADWWRKHIERTGKFKVETAESMENSYHFWKEETEKGPQEWREKDLKAIEADQGEYMGFIKVVAERKAA
jgi:cyclopropane fatty-acyl-phospholipid synthase-like methyltransferase